MPHDLNCKSSDPANGEATVPCLLMSLKHHPVRMQGIVMSAVMLSCRKVALAVSHVFKKKIVSMWMSAAKENANNPTLSHCTPYTI
jgi:hypothetical protein